MSADDLAWLEGGELDAEEAPGGELIPVRNMNKRQLALALNTTPRTLNKWLLDGMPSRPGPGKRDSYRFDLAPVVDWLRARERGEGGDTYAEAKTKAMLAIARKRDIETRKLAGELIPLDWVMRAVEERYIVARQRLLQVDLAAVGLSQEQHHDIENAMRDALNDISQTSLGDEFWKGISEDPTEQPSET